jgi:hypothetical protein
MQPRAATGAEYRSAMIRGGTTEWISVDEAEAITGRSKWSWRRDAYASRIGSSKVGRRLFLRLKDVLEVMDSGYRPSVSELQRLQGRVAS